MTKRIDVEEIRTIPVRKVLSVGEFARRYRLDQVEEHRLLKLFGPFASEQELLMNARRTPQFR